MTWREQRRARRIAMTPDEVDAFLAAERTCRVATVGADGRPHVVPLWFAWDGRALWLTSLVRSQRGVEITGTATPVGDVPRGTGQVPQLAEPERLFARKYAGVDTYTPDGRHAWLKVVPEKIVSWDFRKIPGS